MRVPVRSHDGEFALRHGRGRDRDGGDSQENLLHDLPPKSAARHAHGGTHGGDAEKNWPASRAARGAAVHPVKLELQKDLARHLRGGHPWVYKRAVERPPPGLEAGAIVDVTGGGTFVARGYFDPLSAVRVRVLTRDPSEAIGPLFWRRRIARAAALRRAYVLSADTDCARLVHGEGDGLPGGRSEEHTSEPQAL